MRAFRTCGGAVLAVAVALTLGPAAAADAASGPCGFDLYTLSGTGVVRQVTDTPRACEYNPSWSNDGKQIVSDHVLVDDSGAFVEQSLWITDVATGATTPLAGGEHGNDGAWSPNGRLIAFDTVADVYVVDAQGGERALVTEGGAGAAWSPNSKRLAYAAFSDGSIQTIGLDGGSPTVVAPAGSTVPFSTLGYDVAWSPNGQLIAWSDRANVFVVRVDAQGMPLGPPRQLTFTGTWSGQPSFTQNSKQVVFHSGLGPGLFVVDVDGGLPTPLLLPATEVYDPAVSNDGRFVAFAGRTS